MLAPFHNQHQECLLQYLMTVLFFTQGHASAEIEQSKNKKTYKSIMTCPTRKCLIHLAITSYTIGSFIYCVLGGPRLVGHSKHALVLQGKCHEVSSPLSLPFSRASFQSFCSSEDKATKCSSSSESDIISDHVTS